MKQVTLNVCPAEIKTVNSDNIIKYISKIEFMRNCTNQEPVVEEMFKIFFKTNVA